MNKAFRKLIIAGGALLAIAVELRGQPLALRTLAGNTTPGATNGYGSNARFHHPFGVATDQEGNVYVADMQNGTVRKITGEGFAGSFAGTAGNPGSANGDGPNAQFFGPQGIAVDGGGNVFVADTANGTIRRITPEGTVNTLAGSPTNFNSFDGAGAAAQFYRPEAVAVDAAGNVYVADAWNHTLRKITPAGVVSTLAGLAGNPGSADGTNSKARFHRPAGIAVDTATNLFVTDSLNHTIRKITPDGTVSTIAGLAGVWGGADGTNAAARFYQPQGIVAASATLFVADSGNQTIRRISAAGANWVVSTVAGTAGLAGSTNGSGSAAQFYFPAGLALDGAGYLYVADAGNQLVRTTRIVPPRLMTTRLPGQLLLTWPVSAEDFVLESSPVLGTESLWTPLTNGVVNLGDNFGVTTPTGSDAAFYRLHKP